MEDRHPPRFLESWLLGDGAKSNHPATNSESPVVTLSPGLKRRVKKTVRSARRHIAILAGKWDGGVGIYRRQLDVFGTGGYTSCDIPQS